MKTKIVEAVLTPPPHHFVGDGFRVHNFFPSGYNMDQQRMSPFFMLDYNSKFEFTPTEKQRGVGVHPHRGFETVTIAYHGKIAHHDSYGNSGIIGEGDVQWMTAASGVLHKEYHEKEFSQNGGLFQMVQLWVNLPARFKMSTPKYQELTNDKHGKVLLDDNKGYVDVIAGEYNGTKGPAFTFSKIEMYNVVLKKDAMLFLNFPAHFNTGILVVEGAVDINETNSAPSDNFILFKNEGEKITLTATQDCKLLVLSGEPLNEPIASYGPFLMNTKQELMQAVEDFNNGKFGKLDE